MGKKRGLLVEIVSFHQTLPAEGEQACSCCGGISGPAAMVSVGEAMYLLCRGCAPEVNNHQVQPTPATMKWLEGSRSRAVMVARERQAMATALKNPDPFECT